MISAPGIVETESHPAAVIRLTVPRAEIERHMDAAMAELFGTLAAQGIQPAGPPYAYHLRLDPGQFDFELGVPVGRAVTPTGRVAMGTLPGGRVAQAVYQGPSEGLFEAWGAFNAWIAAQGLKPGPRLWERYLTSPDMVADPARYQTELNRPVG